MSYLYRSTPQILRFQHIPSFFSFTVPLKMFLDTLSLSFLPFSLFPLTFFNFSLFFTSQYLLKSVDPNKKLRSLIQQYSFKFGIAYVHCVHAMYMQCTKVFDQILNFDQVII